MFAEGYMCDFSVFLQSKLILSDNKIFTIRIIIAFLTVASTILYK